MKLTTILLLDTWKLLRSLSKVLCVAFSRLTEFKTEGENHARVKKYRPSEVIQTPLADRFNQLQDAENSWKKKVRDVFKNGETKGVSWSQKIMNTAKREYLHILRLPSERLVEGKKDLAVDTFLLC